MTAEANSTDEAIKIFFHGDLMETKKYISMTCLPELITHGLTRPDFEVNLDEVYFHCHKANYHKIDCLLVFGIEKMFKNE